MAFCSVMKMNESSSLSQDACCRMTIAFSRLRKIAVAGCSVSTTASSSTQLKATLLGATTFGGRAQTTSPRHWGARWCGFFLMALHEGHHLQSQRAGRYVGPRWGLRCANVGDIAKNKNVGISLRSGREEETVPRTARRLRRRRVRRSVGRHHRLRRGGAAHSLQPPLWFAARMPASVTFSTAADMPDWF